MSKKWFVDRIKSTFESLQQKFKWLMKINLLETIIQIDRHKAAKTTLFNLLHRLVNVAFQSCGRSTGDTLRGDTYVLSSIKKT